MTTGMCKRSQGLTPADTHILTCLPAMRSYEDLVKTHVFFHTLAVCSRVLSVVDRVADAAVAVTAAPFLSLVRAVGFIWAGMITPQC